MRNWQNSPLWIVVFIVSFFVYVTMFGTFVAFLASLIGGFALGLMLGRAIVWYESRR